MRRGRPVVLAICLAAALSGAACSQDQPQAPPAPVAQPSPTVAAPPPTSMPVEPTPDRTDEFTDYVLVELAALRVGQSLGEWKKTHPGRAVEVFTGRSVQVYSQRMTSDSNDRWCAHVRFETPLEGNSRLRYQAYFSLPEPSMVNSLPTGTPAELLDQCRFALLSIDVQDVRASLERFAEVTEASLVSMFGEGQTIAGAPSWSGWNSGSDKTISWRQDGLSVVMTRISSRMAVAGAGDPFGVNFSRFVRRDRSEEWVERFRAIASRINEAISIAAVGGRAEEDIRAAVKMLSDANPPLRFPRGGDRTFILNAVKEWLVSAPSSPPARRAAAVFVADQVLDESGVGWAKGENPPIRQQLEANGAQFVWAPIGEVWVYAAALLRESLEIDPDGRIGELAFITLMERGFETSGTCRDQPGNGFRAVILEGGDFLSRKPDSALSPYVHLLMAQAWGDIVTLANRGGYDESESAAYKPEEASARKQAIEEYRLAFASPIQRPVKEREAGKNAWRLMAGLSPTRTYFYCVYD